MSNIYAIESWHGVANALFGDFESWYTIELHAVICQYILACVSIRECGHVFIYAVYNTIHAHNRTF